MSTLKAKPAARVSVEHPAIAWVTVCFVLLVAAASFSISFASISALGELMLVPNVLRPAVPLAIDASLLAFTAAATLFHSRGEKRATRWSWFLVGAATVLSVAANIAHVLLPQGITLSSIVGAALAAAMPLLLLGATHVGVLALVAPPETRHETSRRGATVVVAAPVVQDETNPTVNPSSAVVPTPAPIVVEAAPQQVPAETTVAVPAAVSEPVPAPITPEVAEPAPAPVPQPSEATASTLPATAKQPTTRPRKPATMPAQRSAGKSVTTTVRPMTDEDLPEAIRMTEDGLSRAAIAIHLGVSKSAIQRALVAHEDKATA